MHKIFRNDNLVKEGIIKILLKAHNAILKIYESSNYEIDIKSDNSPLTKADLTAHKIIIEGLKKITPEIPVVSEEDKNSFYVSKDVNLYWIIDPLDGTKEFIKRSGEFTCNIGLIENCRPIYGFVGVPTKNLIYFGGKDYGSYKISKNSFQEEIKCIKNEAPLRIIMSKSHINKDTLNYIKKLNLEYKTVQAGSSLKFLKIAEGKADLYPRLGLTSEWDTAAAHAVLEGAGGSVNQLNGERLVYNKENILNPFFIAKGI